MHAQLAEITGQTCDRGFDGVGGTALRDAGTKFIDGGSAVADGGTLLTDGGTSVTKVGTLVTDGGTSVTKAGTLVTDSGALLAEIGSDFCSQDAVLARWPIQRPSAEHRKSVGGRVSGWQAGVTRLVSSE